MPAEFDALVIGSGHNGLTCACYLAKAGMKVLVLEQYHSFGGMTNTEEITLPGFHSDIHAIGYQAANLSPTPVELDLASHGFELLYPDPCWSHVFPDATCINVHRDIDRTCASIAMFSARDADRWRTEYKKFLAEKDQIIESIYNPPPTIAAQAAAMQAAPGGLDQYRFQLQSVRSWAAETFESEQVRSLVGTWAAHVGLAPDEAGGASFSWLFSMVIQHYGNNAVKGGMRQLPVALSRYLESQGGAIRTGVTVTKIIVANNRAIAVQLSDGERIDVGKVVASNVDPRQLTLRLLGEDVVGHQVARKMARTEVGESNLVIYLALDAPVRFAAGDIPGRSIYVHPSPPTLDFFSELFQQVRAGLLPANPFCLVAYDSVADPSRVPEGRGLMKLVVQPVPWQICGDATGKMPSGGWSDVKVSYADYVVDWLTKNYIPDLSDRICKRVVHSPEDLQRLIPSNPQGSVTHGAMMPYQFGGMRPIPELADYKTPVQNVYLCGSGSHPGPGVSMAPGRNAAQVIYADLGIDFGITVAGAPS